MSTTQVKCECGTIYQRAENDTPQEDCGSFDCLTCGRQLEAWDGPHWPSFTILEKPEASPSARQSSVAQSS